MQFDQLDESEVIWEPYDVQIVHARYPAGFLSCVGEIKTTG